MPLEPNQSRFLISHFLPMNEATGDDAALSLDKKQGCNHHIKRSTVPYARHPPNAEPRTRTHRSPNTNRRLPPKYQQFNPTQPRSISNHEPSKHKRAIRTYNRQLRKKGLTHWPRVAGASVALAYRGRLRNDACNLGVGPCARRLAQ